MAIDTLAKRVSASILYPQPMLIWPTASMDRYGMAWTYNGFAAAPPVPPAPPAVVELFAVNSLITKNLVWISEIIKTLDWDSII